MFYKTTFNYDDLMAKTGIIDVNPLTTSFLRFQAQTGNNIAIYGSYFTDEGGQEHSGQLCGINESNYSVSSSFAEGLIMVDTTGLSKLSIQGYGTGDVFALYSERY